MQEAFHCFPFVGSTGEAPAATCEDVQAAALQFVRKISGYRKPSKVNEAAFNKAVAEIAHAAGHLLQDLETKAVVRARAS